MREWWAKLRAVWHRDRLDEELAAEIDAHLQMEAEARFDRGLSPHDALATARRNFGNVTRIRESSREAWVFVWLENLLQDIRYGLRVLRRSPGFALTAMAVVALGIGATTASFTLLDHVLLRPLPFAHPEQLVMVYETQPASGSFRMQTSPPNFIDWRAMSRSFDRMGAYITALFPVNLSGHGEPQRLDSVLVNSDLFQTLGVQPAAGRVFTADDDRVGGPNVVVLSDSLATALFGASANAVGRSVSLDNQANTIIGVMPANFAFPSPAAQLWRPLRFTPGMMASRSNPVLYAVARLRPETSIGAARAEMDVIAAQLQRAYPKDNARSGIAVADLRALISPQSRLLVLALFGAALCLMLIACTNLANLLLARAVARRQEIAVRIAIGAGRERLLRQLFTESLVLAVAGGSLALLLAAVMTPLLARLVPGSLPVGSTPGMDHRIFAFAALLTVSTALVFGMGPAFPLGPRGRCYRAAIARCSRWPQRPAARRARARRGHLHGDAAGRRGPPGQGALARASQRSRIPHQGRADVADRAADAQIRRRRDTPRFLLARADRDARPAGSPVGRVRQLSADGRLQR
jgi:predicted permease